MKLAKRYYNPPGKGKYMVRERPRHLSVEEIQWIDHHSCPLLIIAGDS